MTEPLVSIIIPVYNAEKYIEQCIDSVLAQTWKNIEVIIVDDSSTDGSLTIAKRYENTRLKILTQSNKGASAARNTGLKEAKGEYIQFLDADDLLSNNKIESQISRLVNFPEHLALCTTVHFQNNTDHTRYPVQHDWYKQGSDDPVDFLIKLYGGPLIGPAYGGMIQTGAWLTPKSLLLKAGQWNEMRNPDDDGEFFCRIILASKGIVYAYDAINYYRKFNTNNSLSGKKNREALSNILKSTDLKMNHLLSRTDQQITKMVFSRLYYENAFIFYPQYMDLANEAEKKAKSLVPDYRFTPYHTGIKAILANLLGWKTVRKLQHLNFIYK